MRTITLVGWLGLDILQLLVHLKGLESLRRLASKFDFFCFDLSGVETSFS